MRALVVVGLAAVVVLLGARAAAQSAPATGQDAGPHRIVRPPPRFDDARRQQADRPFAERPGARPNAPGPTPFGAGGPPPSGAGGAAPFGAGGSAPFGTGGSPP